MNLGYWLTDNLRAYVGYNFLYWTNVIRPGDQIDHVVDLSFVPNSPALPPSGQLRPAPLFKQTDSVGHRDSTSASSGDGRRTVALYFV